MTIKLTQFLFSHTSTSAIFLVPLLPQRRPSLPSPASLLLQGAPIDREATVATQASIPGRGGGCGVQHRSAVDDSGRRQPYKAKVHVPICIVDAAALASREWLCVR